MTLTKLWLPTIPYTLVDAINRHAAATGSMGYAMQTAHADYNGHYVRVHFNEYRGYWISEYQWGERVVVCRGTAQECLRAAHDYYKKGDKGSTVIVEPLTAEEDIAFAKSLGYVEHTGAEVYKGDWMDARFGKINEAFMYEKQLGVPAIGMLANSATVAEYDAKVKAALEVRHRK